MDGLTFASKLVEFGAWPTVALAIVFVLRNDLSTLLATMTKFKAGPVELERVVKELEKTKEIAVAAAGKVNAVAAKFDEADENSLSETRLQAVSASGAAQSTQALSEIEKKVLKAMVDSRFVTRSVTGVAKDSGLSKSDVQATYGSLIAKGLVEQTTNNEGKLRWVVTALGRQIISLD